MLETSQARTINLEIKLQNCSRPTIAVILSRGESIRNFVYSGTLNELSRNVEVNLLSVIPNQEIKEMLEGEYNGVHELHYTREHRIVRIQREILDLAHGRWLWSEAAKERWRLRDLEANSAPLLAKRLAKKLLCYPFANRIGLDLLAKVESLSSQWLRPGDEYEQLFKEMKPALVFNGSHVHSRISIEAIRAAQRLGIPTATFIFSWDNLTSQGRIIPPYDYYLVWNNSLRDQLLNIYRAIRPEQVFVTGTPQFDFHFRPEHHWTRKEFCERIGADPSRPIILYTTGMANHMPEEISIVKGLASMLKQMDDLGSPQLLVRVYPKDQTGRFNKLKQDCPEVLLPAIPWEPNWLTPLIEDSYLLTNMLRHSAVGINVASTVSLEMCMFDKPVINIGYNPPEVPTAILDYARYYEFDHYRPIVESGAVEVAYSEADLRRMLGEALAQPEKLAAPRKALIHNFFGNSLDGWSSARVANVLELLVAKSQASK